MLTDALLLHAGARPVVTQAGRAIAWLLPDGKRVPAPVAAQWAITAGHAIVEVPEVACVLCKQPCTRGYTTRTGPDGLEVAVHHGCRPEARQRALLPSSPMERAQARADARTL